MSNTNRREFLKTSAVAAGAAAVAAPAIAQDAGAPTTRSAWACWGWAGACSRTWPRWPRWPARTSRSWPSATATRRSWPRPKKTYPQLADLKLTVYDDMRKLLDDKSIDAVSQRPGRPLARAVDDLGLPGGQGRVRGEARHAQPVRGPPDGRRRAQVQPHGAARHAEPLEPQHPRGHPEAARGERGRPVHGPGARLQAPRQPGHDHAQQGARGAGLGQVAGPQGHAALQPVLAPPLVLAPGPLQRLLRQPGGARAGHPALGPGPGQAPGVRQRHGRQVRARGRPHLAHPRGHFVPVRGEQADGDLRAPLVVHQQRGRLPRQVPVRAAGVPGGHDLLRRPRATRSFPTIRATTASSGPSASRGRSRRTKGTRWRICPTSRTGSRPSAPATTSCCTPTSRRATSRWPCACWPGRRTRWAARSRFDPATEKVLGDDEADRMLNEPEYRKPYVVPKDV